MLGESSSTPNTERHRKGFTAEISLGKIEANGIVAIATSSRWSILPNVFGADDAAA